MDLKDLQYWNHWKLLQLHTSFRADFIHCILQIYGLWEVWGTIFQAFWVLGHNFFMILVIIGCKGALRRGQNGFSEIVDGFWVSHWRPFWITFSYVLWFEQSKITFWLQSRFLLIFERNFWWILIVNSCVFVRFHFFDFFMNLMFSGTCLDLIFVTFGGLGRQF